MSLTHVTTLSQLNGILSKSNDKLSVSLECGISADEMMTVVGRS